jgi:hypothetical protein
MASLPIQLINFPHGIIPMKSFSACRFHYQLPVRSAIQMVLVTIALTAGMTHIASARGICRFWNYRLNLSHLACYSQSDRSPLCRAWAIRNFGSKSINVNEAYQNSVLSNNPFADC